MLASLRALAALTAFCPGLVVGAIPQPTGIGSLDGSIKYFPNDVPSWGRVVATDGFSKVNGTALAMFAIRNAARAEVIWITPSKCHYFRESSSAGDLSTLGHHAFQTQRKSLVEPVTGFLKSACFECCRQNLEF